MVIEVITINFIKGFATYFVVDFATYFVMDFTTYFIANSYFNYLIGINIGFDFIKVFGVENIIPLNYLIVKRVVMVVIFIIEAVYLYLTITIFLITN